jgi:hypothetical protein
MNSRILLLSCGVILLSSFASSQPVQPQVVYGELRSDRIQVSNIDVSFSNGIDSFQSVTDANGFYRVQIPSSYRGSNIFEMKVQGNETENQIVFESGDLERIDYNLDPEPNQNDSGSEDSSDDTTDSSSGGSGGIISPGQEQNNQDAQELDISVRPSYERIILNKNQSEIYSPLVSVSRPADVKVTLQGLEEFSSFSEKLEIENDAVPNIVLTPGDEVESGDYSGQLRVEHNNDSASTNLAIVLEPAKKSPMSITVSNNSENVSYSISLEDMRSNFQIEINVIDESGEIIYQEIEGFDSNHRSIEKSIPRKNLEKGNYELVTYVYTQNNTFTSAENFVVEDRQRMEIRNFQIRDLVILVIVLAIILVVSYLIFKIYCFKKADRKMKEAVRQQIEKTKKLKKDEV